MKYIILNLYQYTAFFHSIRLSVYKMEIKFDRDLLAVEQNNYLIKIINVYIVYVLADWPRNPTNNFKFKNCLFGATNIVEKSDKEKYVYSGYGITFDSAGSWSFGNGTARNFIVFDVDNSSSSHVDNHKNNFLILVLGSTYGINGSFGSPQKIFSINFTKEINFPWVYIIMLIIVICLLKKKETIKLQADNKNVNFLTRFCLGNISDWFSAAKSREVSLNGNGNDFSVDYNSINKSHILNISKYFMTKNNIR